MNSNLTINEKNVKYIQKSFIPMTHINMYSIAISRQMTDSFQWSYYNKKIIRLCRT